MSCLPFVMGKTFSTSSQIANLLDIFLFISCSNFKRRICVRISNATKNSVEIAKRNLWHSLSHRENVFANQQSKRLTNSMAICPRCQSLRLDKDGLRYLPNGNVAQRFLCKECYYRFTSTKSSVYANKDSRLDEMDAKHFSLRLVQKLAQIDN